MKQLAVVLALIAVAGCARVGAPDGAAGTEAQDTGAGRLERTAAAGPAGPAAARGDAAPGVSPAGIQVAAGAPAAGRTFATLPDRGELLAYRGAGPQVKGAYTWHQVAISEQHALRAIATGTMRVATPGGKLLDIVYDHHVEHPSGDMTWVGHVAGHAGAQAIITFGAGAVYGTIDQPDTRSLRLTTRSGSAWLVETDPVKLAALADARGPRDPDHLPVPAVRPSAEAAQAQRLVSQARAAAAPVTAAAAAAPVTVDLLIGYTNGFAPSEGVSTRLNYLVAVGNEALANSQVNLRIRLVHAMAVDYSNTTSNGTALEQLTGYDSDSGEVVRPDAAFDALRAARERYGADLVTLVRPFRDPEHDGCGIAWLVGGARTGVTPGDGQDYFGYSVVSDGEDENEDDGHTYYCQDETLVHELGHNMGSQHDQDTAAGDDGTIDDEDYGAFSYSFGYKTSAAAGNFYTVMAYGDSGQIGYRVFSNPRIDFCGGAACGTSAREDNARSLGQIAPAVAAFRTSVVEPVATSAQAAVAGNFNGDGRYDIFWRHQTRGGNVIWRSASASTQTPVTSVTDTGWSVAGVGDFNRDGRSDVVWRHAVSGRNVIWRSGSASAQQAVTAVTDTRWAIAGVGDFNGDGRSDLLWRHGATGRNAIWLSGNSAIQRTVTTVTGTSWKIVAVGDFNGDGRADIAWRNSSDGSNTIWLSGNSATQRRIGAVGDPDWRIVGAGDVNGDGRDDLVWRHVGNGRNTVWLSGYSSTQRAVASVTDTAWAIASIGDFNGDGRADLLWRHSGNGRNVIWRSAYSTAQTAVTAVTDLSWLVAG